MIDEFYDFAAHVLDAQREFARQFIATTTAAAEKVRDGLAPIAKATTDKARTAKVAAVEVAADEVAAAKATTARATTAKATTAKIAAAKAAH